MPRFNSFEASAFCTECDWETDGKNAHGIAVQHHRRTGHTVNVEQIQSFTYTTENSEWVREWKRLHNVAADAAGGE